MRQRETHARTDGLAFSAALLFGFATVGAIPQQAGAEPYRLEMMLHGAPVESKVSGFSGTRRTLQVDDGEHAMYGVSSEERRDNPCMIWIGTESINDSLRNGEKTKNLCGGTPSSREIKAEFRDTMEHGPRVFVTAIRVCTNKKGNRVKGFQLSGMKIYETPPDTEPESQVGWTVFRAGYGLDIEFPNPRQKYVDDPETPADFRNNCKEWQKWAECPYQGQVATGLIAHFDAGKEPRSLTGVALQCRYISLPYVPSALIETNRDGYG